MAENIVLSAGSSGDTLAADEISVVKYQRVKITVGADGVNDGDVASGNPMPTDLREFAGVVPSVTNPIPQRLSDGTTFIPFPTALVGGRLSVDVGVSALPSGAATSALQLAAGHTVAQAGAPWEVDGGVTHNAGSPAALSLLGILPAMANAADPSVGENRLVLLSTDLAGALRVVAGALPLPSGAATSGAQLAAGHTVSQAGGPWTVEGELAHDAPDAGTNPFKIGANAVDFSLTELAEVAADDVTDLRATRQGILFTIGGSPHVVTTVTNITAAATNGLIGPAVASGETFVLTALTVYAGNANVADVDVNIGYGTATIGTNVWRADEIAPGGGATFGNGGGILARGASDEELRWTTVGAEEITVTTVGFIEPI